MSHGRRSASPQTGPSRRPTGGSAGGSLRRRVASLAGLTYLVVQLLVPIVVLVRPGRTWRDFSWDMFSHELSCTQLHAITRIAGGPWNSVRLDLDFGSWAQLRRVLTPGRFETYARHLCQTLRTEQGRPVQLYFLTQCHDDRHTRSFALVDPNRDYCQTP